MVVDLHKLMASHWLGFLTGEDMHSERDNSNITTTSLHSHADLKGTKNRIHVV